MATLRVLIKTEPQSQALRQVAVAKHTNLMTGNLEVYIALLTVEGKLSKVPYLCKSFTTQQLDLDLGDAI